MAKYHINTKGEPGKCSAKKTGCPFGDASEHYDNLVDARNAYEAAQGAPFSDYDLEEMNVLNRMKEVLVRKHNWDNEDFEDMTFTDIESEFLDTYGEKDFRPTEVQAEQEQETENAIMDAEYAMVNNMRIPLDKRGRYYTILLALDDDEEEWMTHKPFRRKELAERLRATLRYYEDEAKIYRDGGKSPLYP